jgi:hypothetical protein
MSEWIQYCTGTVIRLDYDYLVLVVPLVLVLYCNVSCHLLSIHVTITVHLATYGKRAYFQHLPFRSRFGTTSNLLAKNTWAHEATGTTGNIF